MINFLVEYEAEKRAIVKGGPSELQLRLMLLYRDLSEIGKYKKLWKKLEIKNVAKLLDVISVEGLTYEIAWRKNRYKKIFIEIKKYFEESIKKALSIKIPPGIKELEEKLINELDNTEVEESDKVAKIFEKYFREH